MLNLFRFSAVLLMIFSIFSCSSGNSENDSDTVPDADSDVIEIADGDTDSSQDFDFVDDPYEKTDSDTPETVECLDLRYNENTIKTPFPFKDANGKPTFCRPGCDTPTENDPQCDRNIWDWENWDEQENYLKEQEKNPN